MGSFSTPQPNALFLPLFTPGLFNSGTGTDFSDPFNVTQYEYLLIVVAFASVATEEFEAQLQLRVAGGSFASCYGTNMKVPVTASAGVAWSSIRLTAPFFEGIGSRGDKITLDPTANEGRVVIRPRSGVMTGSITGILMNSRDGSVPSKVLNLVEYPENPSDPNPIP